MVRQGVLRHAVHAVQQVRRVLDEAAHPLYTASSTAVMHTNNKHRVCEAGVFREMRGIDVYQVTEGSGNLGSSRHDSALGRACCSSVQLVLETALCSYTSTMASLREKPLSSPKRRECKERVFHMILHAVEVGNILNCPGAVLLITHARHVVDLIRGYEGTSTRRV